MLHITPNEPFKFRTKNWFDDSREMYKTNSQTKFKTSMLKSGLCDYNHAYILVKGTISFANTAAGDDGANIANIILIPKTYAPFTDCRREIDNTQINNTKNVDIVIPVYKLIE